MVLIGAGHTLEDPGILYNDQNEFEVCKRLVTNIQEILIKNNIECAVVPFDYPIKDRAKWIKSNNYNNKENIYVELHLSPNSCAHVITNLNEDKLKSYLFKYFDSEAEIDVEEVTVDKQKKFDILGKLTAKTFIVEAGNIIDYIIDSDYTLTADAMSHSIADYLNAPFSSNAPIISNDDVVTHIKQTMDSNTRREEIKTLYKNILGREADTNGVAYYMIHLDITLEQIAKDMIESTDHAQILQRANEFVNLQALNASLSQKISVLEKDIEVKQAMIQNHDAIAQEKSMATQQDVDYQYQQYPQYSYPQQTNYSPVDIPQQYEQIQQQSQPPKKGILHFLKSVMGK